MIFVPLKKGLEKELAVLAQKCGLFEWNQTQVEDSLSSSGIFGFMALQGRQLVGAIFGAFDPLQPEIHFFCVNPLWQKKGVGAALLKNFEQYILHHSHLNCAALGDSPQEPVVHLEVRASNGVAQSFYKKHGFVFTRRRRDYYALLPLEKGAPVAKGSTSKGFLLDREDAFVYQKQLN